MPKLKLRRDTNRRKLLALNPDPDLPRGYLSNSAVGTYLKCARQYEWAYVEKVIIPPEIALEEGISHHGALDKSNSQFIKKGKFFRKTQLIECFMDTFNDRAKEIPKFKWTMAGEKKDDVLVRGNLMLDNYYEGYGKKIKPVASEQRIELMVGGVPFLGFIDVIMKGKVIDYKVVKQAKSQGEADGDIQLSTYCKATKLKKAEFVCLTKTKNGNTKVIETKRGPKDADNLGVLVASVADAIKKGSFPMCDPTNWICNPKWCGYYRRCKG